MTRHAASTAPLRRSSAPSRILSAGLATATCVGIVGLLGTKTIEANAEAQSPAPEEAAVQEASLASSAPATTVEAADAAQPVLTSSQGMTQADLDAYAAALAEEKARLDAYRAKLVRTAKKLKKLAARANEQGPATTTWSAPTSTSGTATSGSSKSNSSKTGSSSKPASKKSSGTTSSAPQQPAAPAQPAQPAAPAQPAPQPAAAPAQKQAPAQQPSGGGGGGAQTTTKSS